MEPTPESIAADMLADDTGSGPIHDLLLRTAEPLLSERTATICAAPTGTAALELAARSLHAARYVAKHCTDTDALTELYRRDRRATVRRELAANPHISADVASGLYTWAMRDSNQDHECVYALVENPAFNLDEIAATYRNGGIDWLNVAAIFGRISDRAIGNADTGDDNTEDAATAAATADAVHGALVDFAVAAGPAVIEALAVRFANHCDPLTQRCALREGTLGRLEAHADTNVRRALTKANIERSDGPIDPDLAREAHTMFNDTDDIISGFVSGWNNYPIRPERLDAESAALWASSNNTSLRNAGLSATALDPNIAAAHVGNPDTAELLAHRSAATGDIELARALLCAHDVLTLRDAYTGSALIAELADELYDASNATANDAKFNTGWILDHLFEHLDTDRRLAALRRGNDGLTENWVGRTGGTGPRAGEITALLDNPGHAFDDRYFFDDDVTDDEPDTRSRQSRVRSMLCSARADQFTDTALDELFELIEGPFRETGTQLWSEAAKRLRSAIGDNVAALEVAISMAPDWGGTIPELATVARGITAQDG